MNKMFETLKRIYKNKKYVYISLITAIISFIIFYQLTVAKIADNSLKIYIMMSGYNFTYFSLLSFAIISALFGIYLSVIIYKYEASKKLRKNSFGFFGFVGALVGAFGAGCPTCGAVLFGLIGSPLALMYFPYKGMELRVLSIIILIIATYLTIKSLNKCETCEIK